MISFLSKETYAYIILLLVSLFVFIFSTHYAFFSLNGFLMLFTNGLNAYLIDQLFFLVVLLLLLGWALYKKQLTLSLTPFLIFVLFLVILLVFQSEVLNKYFIKEDYYLLLGMLNSAVRDPTLSLYSVNFYTVYPYVSFVVLYQLFGQNAFYYNVASLVLMSLSGMLLYQLLAYLTHARALSDKIVILLLALVYVVSPIIMEIYVWVQLGHANGYVVSGMLISAYFYLKFVQTRKFLFFALCLIMVLFLLKTALVRTTFWPVCLVFLDLIYLSKTKKEFAHFLLRASSLLLPLLFLTLPVFVIPITHENYTISQRLYMFFYYQIPSIIPYQFYSPAYKFLISFLEPTLFVDGFFYNNLFFVFGVILFFLVTTLTLILLRRGSGMKVLLFFWICNVVCFVFFTSFSNWGAPPATGSADKPFINYAEVPSSRYYTYTYLFLMITICLQYFALAGRRIGINLLFSVLLLAVLISNINFTQKMTKNMNKDSAIPLKTVSEAILNLVPDVDEARIIYQPESEPHVVKFLGFDGFTALFKYPPKNIYSKEELSQYLQDHDIKEENIYSYSFDEQTLKFEDKSREVRQEFKDYFNK